MTAPVSVADAFPDSTAARRGIRLRGVNCMSNCKRPCTIALSGPGRFIHLFGDLDPTLHAGDVLSVAAAYAEAEGTFLPRPARPEVLRADILCRTMYASAASMTAYGVWVRFAA